MVFNRHTFLVSKSAVVFLVLFFFVSCKNNGVDTTTHNIETKKSPALNLNALDSLEKIFDNDNWMMVNAKDTSFYYFSRTQPTALKIYHFHLLKGDTVNTIISEIKFVNDTLNWQFNDKELRLLNAGIDKALWIENNGKDSFSINKKSDKRIDILDTKAPTIILNRTLTLSTFLARSQYDYKHNTRFAFDTIEFTKGKNKADTTIGKAN